MVYHGISLMNQWRCLNSPTTGGLSKPDFPFSRKDGPQIISKVARCGMVWRIEKTISRPPFHGKIYHKKNSRCTEGMLLLSANLELQAQAFANAFTNAPHIIYVLRTQICLYMCMHFSIVSIYKLSGPWGTCLKSDCCMFHICSHHKQSNLTFVHPAIKRNRISSIYGGLKKLGKSMN